MRRFGGERVVPLLLSAALIVAAAGPILMGRSAYAAQITSRSLTLQAGASDGGSKISGNVYHFFSFTLPGGNTVGSIQFLYCTAASGTCNTPAGLSTTSATLGSESGVTGNSIVATTNGAPYLTRSAAAIGSNVSASYQLRSITNPNTATTFYVRISTFTATNATGSPLDTGVVAAATVNQISLTGTMPESLIFCTGGTVGVNGGGIPDCTTATSGSLQFNQLFSPTDTATVTSQMAASTNGTTGYNITVNGVTLTSGANTIAAMSSSGPGVRSTSQFGMNLKANTTATSTVAVGTEVAPAANSTTLKGQAATGYDTVDNFKFVSGDTVANSAAGGAGPTNAQIFTASYIVNVAGSQVAGSYATTLTYICTATF